MRDTPGSAAAPVARYRNRRRGNFIICIPQVSARGAIAESPRRFAYAKSSHPIVADFIWLSRPHRAVIPKRNGGPRPVRRGFRQLHGWLQVAEPARWCLTYRRPTFQFPGGELSRHILKRGSRHFAEINDPLSDLSERDPYQPAATFPRPARQCHHRAKCHQITRAIVDRRGRVELWLRSLVREALRLTYRHAADGLHHRVEAAPRRPGAGMTEGGERNVDEPRPDRSQLLRREAAVGQGARTISLREHICLAHQPTQDIDIGRHAQIEFGRKLAVPGIPFLIPKAGQMRAGDLQDVSAVLGERAGTRRSGEDAGKVEDADAREWPITGWQRLGGAVADAYDLHER